MGRHAEHDEDRVRGLARLEPDEVIVACVRVWVSRGGRLRYLRARDRDVALLTDRRLMLFATGFWSRRPGRRVLAERLDELTEARDLGRAPYRTLELSRPGHAPVILWLRGEAESRELAEHLVSEVRRREAS